MSLKGEYALTTAIKSKETRWNYALASISYIIYLANG